MENIIWVALVCAVLALVFAAWKTSVVSKADAGTERMREIAESISDGARAFLFAEYKILVIFVAVLFVLIGLFITWLTAVCFLIGAVFSVCAGYVGMNVATKANVRTAAPAKASFHRDALFQAYSASAGNACLLIKEQRCPGGKVVYDGLFWAAYRRTCVLAGRNGELVVQIDAAKQGIQEMVSIWAGTGDF